MKYKQIIKEDVPKNALQLKYKITFFTLIIF